MDDSDRSLDDLHDAVAGTSSERERLDALLARARALFNSGPPEAIGLASGALAIAERMDDPHATATCRCLIGMLCVQLGELPRARGELRAAAAIFESIGDQSGVARTMTCRGIVSNDFGQYVEALDEHRTALELYERLGEKNGIAAAKMNIANVYQNLGDLTKCLEYLQPALSLYELAGNRQGVAGAMGNIGTVYFDLGDLERALEYHRAARSMFEELDDLVDVAISLGNMGNALWRLGDRNGAMEHYQRARTLSEQLGERDGLSRVSRQIGLLYQEMGEYSKAFEHYGAALAAAEEIGSASSIASAIADMASLYALEAFDGHDPALAESYLLRAIETMNTLGNRRSVWFYHDNLAALYEQMGRWKEAHAQLRRSQEIREEVRSLDSQKKAEQIEHLRIIAETERRRERERIEQEALREALTLRTQLLEAQLEQQRAELAAKAIQIARQAETLGEFRSELLGIVQHGGESQLVVKRITEKLQMLPAEQIDWARFEAEFRALYPTFQSDLLQRYPDLSGMELKVCALLKLKLISSDIARILRLSERSVEGHRLHIRRKMGLTGRDDVHGVLASV